MRSNTDYEKKLHTAADVEAVVTSYNQGGMILEAVQSLCMQTTPPGRIILVDDGSTGKESRAVLKEIKENSDTVVPIILIEQENRGVSAARNKGIENTRAPLVLVLDGDDRLEPSYVEEVSHLLRNTPSMTAASSWMKTFGVLEAEVRPQGGGIESFLPRNACPAAHIFRRKAWEKCGGYDETMRSGFEDWDFFLSMLEAMPDTGIGIVETPLIDYRTASASSNITSMKKRLSLLEYLIEKHKSSYQKHLKETLLAMEAISMGRLYGWEEEIRGRVVERETMSGISQEFLKHPSYGDGGMAAAVRIVSAKKRSEFQK